MQSWSSWLKAPVLKTGEWETAPWVRIPDSAPVRLYAKGPCDVTCTHIEHDSDVEIINPDCHIASLGPDAELYMEIVLDKGRGYVSADKNKLSLKNNIQRGNHGKNLCGECVCNAAPEGHCTQV